MTGEEICHRIRRYLARSYQAGVPIRRIGLGFVDWFAVRRYLKSRGTMGMISVAGPWGQVIIDRVWYV